MCELNYFCRRSPRFPVLKGQYHDKSELKELRLLIIVY